MHDEDHTRLTMSEECMMKILLTSLSKSEACMMKIMLSCLSVMKIIHVRLSKSEGMHDKDHTFMSIRDEDHTCEAVQE